MGMPTTNHTEFFTRTPSGVHRRGLFDLPHERWFHNRETMQPGTSKAELLLAFAGFAQSQLIESTRNSHLIRSAGPSADRALDWLRRSGFSIEDVQALQFGLYPTPAEVEAYLIGVGFRCEQSRQTEFGDWCSPLLQQRWSDCLVVPLFDRLGEIADLGFVNFDRDPAPTIRCLYGATATGIVAYGLNRVLTHEQRVSQTAGRDALILVEDVIDGWSLQCRGFWNVAAVGTLEEMSSHRWEALRDLGFTRVDLVFRNRAAQPARVRQFLTTREGAARCPEVHVFDSTQFGPGESASEFVTRQGRDAFRRLLEGRSFVRRQWVESAFSPRAVADAAQSWQAFQPERFWEAINHRLHTVGDQVDHIECQQMADDVARSLASGQFDNAHQMLDQWPIERWQKLATAPVASPNVVSVHAALDVVCADTARQAPFREAEPHSSAAAGDVTVIRASDARTRRERLIDALLNDLYADDDGLSVVVVAGGLPQFVTLLVHRMVAQRAEGCGLSVSEVAARLRGDGPSEGFRDKPWLVDEAVDSLSGWSERLCFIEPSADRAGLMSQLHSLQRTSGPLAGVYFDLSDQAQRSRGHLEHPADAFDWSALVGLSRDFDCPIVAVGCGKCAEESSPLPPEEERTSGRVRRRAAWFDVPESSVVGTYRRDAHDFRSLLRHWIVQTERRTRFEQPSAASVWS